MNTLNMPLPSSSPTTVGKSRERSSEDSIRQMARPKSKSPAALGRIKIKNRRKRYLDLHPDYFISPLLELAGLPRAQLCPLQVRMR